MCGLEADLELAWPPDQWRDVTIVVGVSGGADSVALARALVSIRHPGPGRLVVAHFHHGLRGAEADADATFVLAFCDQWNLPCELGRASPADDDRVSEATLRAARYRFLREVAHRQGARFVAVAHTADDQIETILHRLFRGTGLAGLRGMPRTRRLSPLTTLIRPLLAIRRQDLRDYLAARNQLFREDSSNLDPRYTRNRLRHELIPWVERNLNAQAGHAILRLARQIDEEERLVRDVVDQLRRETERAQGDDWLELNVAMLATHDPALIRRLLVSIWSERDWPAGEMNFARWDALAALARTREANGERSSGAEEPATSRRLQLPGGIDATVTPSGRLRLERASAPTTRPHASAEPR